jgi:hypothetical protein
METDARPNNNTTGISGLTRRLEPRKSDPVLPEEAGQALCTVIYHVRAQRLHNFMPYDQLAQDLCTISRCSAQLIRSEARSHRERGSLH